MGTESVSFAIILEGFNIIFWNVMKVGQINLEDAILIKCFSVPEKNILKHQNKFVKEFLNIAMDFFDKHRWKFY